MFRAHVSARTSPVRFRKPRETNWVIGILLVLMGFMEGFTGYSLPDDLLSGTGPADHVRLRDVDPGDGYVGQTT